MKKIVCIVIAFILALPSGTYAMEFFGTAVESIPSEWEITSTPSGNSGASLIDDNLNLYFNTTASAARGSVILMTDYFEANDTELYFSFEMSATENTSSVTRVFSILDTKAANMVELFKINPSSLSVFGGEAFADFDYTVTHPVIIAIDTSDGKGSFWLDGQCLYSGNLSKWKSGMDLANLRFRLTNSASASVSEYSSWNILNFKSETFVNQYDFSSMPSDGQKMIEVSGLEDINIYFGTKVSPTTLKKGNYTLTKDEIEIDFGLFFENEVLQIKPTDGFNKSSAYCLTIDKITDIYENLMEGGKKIEFTSAYDDYERPQIKCLSISSDSLNEGQSGTITYGRLNGEIKYIQVFVNDVIEAALVSEPYIFNFLTREEGSYAVRATAYDSFGGFGNAEDITITVLKNYPPVVNISGISDGSVYDIEILPEIQVSASDDDGIDKISMSVDGKLSYEVKASTAVLNLNGISGGSHVVEIAVGDIHGRITTHSFHISIVKDQYTSYYFNDFTNYKGNNTLPDGMTGGPQRGYLGVDVIDEEHGNSLLIGIDTANTAFAEGNPAYVALPTNLSSGAITCEMDLLISAKASNYELSFKKYGSTEMRFIRFTTSTVNYFNQSGIIGVSEAYNTGEWYGYKVYVDITNRIFRIYDGDGRTIIGNGILPDDMDVIDHIRIYGISADIVKTFMAVDNVELKHTYFTPEIIMQNNIVNYTADSISFQLSANAAPESLTADKIMVTNEFGKVKTGGVSIKSGVITVKLLQPLYSNMKYKLTIDKSVNHISGPAFGVDISADFETTVSDFEILSGSYISKGDGTYFEFIAINKTGTDKKAVVICQAWDGNQYKWTFADEVKIVHSSSQNTYSIKVKSNVSYEDLKTCIWDGLKTPISLSKYVYTN